MDFFAFHEKVTKRSAKAEAAESTASGKQRDVLTITQLTALIDKALKDCLPGTLTVKGEISNYKHHAGSGHLYFTLKDAGACVDCVMFKSDAARLKFTPQDGMELLATGHVGVYGQRGRYQLYVSRLEPIGQGALELAFRQLCAKLEGEGLFAPERKKAIPPFPQRVVLVTSTQTAAVQDMLKVLRRFPWVRVLVYHVPVQGDGSAEKIAAAIDDLNQRAADVGGVDVILLGRGGGSLEDLWEFNEEIVARAIVRSGIPIITGIGHEIDVSVADLVADYHAHTPTEAAQVASAQWRTARDVVETCGVRLRREMRTMLQQLRQRLAQVDRHPVFRRPMDRINTARQMLDDRQRALALAMGTRLRKVQMLLHQLSTRLEQCQPAAIVARLRSRLAGDQQRLIQAAHQRIGYSRESLLRLVTALSERHPRHRLVLYRERVGNLSQRLDRAMQQTVGRCRRDMEAMAAHLNAIGPEQVLKRGYSITVLKKKGTVVRSAAQVKPGERLVTRLADGTVESTVEDSAQMSLFE
ncbi:MAG TPA: exodeoxyribonuclease VII large subunit [Tepidisphaeraceae bacterium]|nr:exodeoxyribonuclease VII large subunit [Tepidisphaeraceae bacterium]